MPKFEWKWLRVWYRTSRLTGYRSSTGPRDTANSNTCKFEKDLIKNNREKVETSFFPIISQWALSVAMETSFDEICAKTLCSLSPTPVMLHIKFVHDWPTVLRNIQVHSVVDDDNGWMDGGPLICTINSPLCFTAVLLCKKIMQIDDQISVDLVTLTCVS